MIDLSAYQGIIFDMDGTLVDSMGSHLIAWEKTCDAFGFPFDREYMYKLGGVPTRKTVEILNDAFDKAHDVEKVSAYKEVTWKQLDHTPTLIADTLAVFNHYYPTMPVSIGTGAEREDAEALLRYHGLFDKITALVTATDVTHGKPHPETFLTAAGNMNVSPEKCVVFEDTRIGLEAAHRAGMDCYLVENGTITQPVRAASLPNK